MSAADDVERFFHAVDDRAWPAVRARLTDEVSSDYTSLFGGAPERLTGDALMTRWQGLLPGFDGTDSAPARPAGDRADRGRRDRGLQRARLPPSGRVDVAGRLP